MSGEQVKCPKCASENRAGVRFCEACGSELPAVATPDAQAVGDETQPSTCPSCGEENRAQVLFCEACGESLAEPMEQMCLACGAANRMEVMFCESCGGSLAEAAEHKCLACDAVNRADVQFCEACGVSLAEPILRLCMSCGAENRVGVRFCEGCGERLKEVVKAKPARKPVRWRIPVWAGVLGGAAVAMVCVIGGLAMFLGGGGLGTPSRQPSYQSAPDYQAPTRTPRPPATSQPEQAYPTQSQYQEPTEAPSWSEPTATPQLYSSTATSRPLATATLAQPSQQYALAGVSLADCAREDVVCVAVIDSGVDVVGNLVGRVLSGKDFYGRNDTSDLRPNGDYHGTTVAQEVISVAPGAYIIPVKARWGLVDEAITWSHHNNADIINISMHGSYSACENVNLFNAIDNARFMGVPIFGAATCGWDANLSQCTLTGRMAPADCEMITGVGAIFGDQIRYNTDQYVVYEVYGQSAPSWAAGYVSGIAANMLLGYPEIYDVAWPEHVDDELLTALECRAAAGMAPSLKPMHHRGLLAICEDTCQLDWCP